MLSSLRRALLPSRRFSSVPNSNLLARAGVSADSGAQAVVADGNRTLSYGDLDKATGRVARVLRYRYGMQKGDRLLARTGKSLDSLLLYLGALRLGVVYVPLNPSYTPEETDHFVRDSSPSLFVTSLPKEDGTRFKDSIRHVVREAEIPLHAAEFKDGVGIEHTATDDIAVICYTSGTTGLPKGAMLTHGNLSSSAETMVKEWQFTGADRLLHSLPFYHVHGMFISLNCALFSHSSILWRERFTVDDTIDWLPKSTVMMGVPTYFSRLLASPKFTRDTVKNIRIFVSGSAPLSPAVWTRFRDHTGIEIVERYGMTEAQVVTTNPVDGERIVGTVGPPVRDTQVRLNANGIIETKSAAVFKGYWRNPKKTAEDFTSDGWFITGDIGAIDEKGYVSILGRGKDMVISGGLNVYPKQIEDVLDHVEGVAESAVIGAPHPDLGEGVVAVIALKKPIEGSQKAAEESRIIKEAKKKLAGYKVPKRVIFLPELPRNHMSKVQKNVLREQYKALFE